MNKNSYFSFLPAFYFSVLLFIVSGGEVFAQNLVPNPSFETYVNCPTGNSQLVGNLPPWDNPSGSGVTPDYFNACAAPNAGCQWVDVPDNFAGTIPAFDGDGYPGIIGYYTSCPNCREYIQAPLTQALVAGQKYTLSMRVRLGDQSNYAIDRMGMHVSVLPPSQPGNQPINTVVPQLEDTLGIGNTNTWVLLSTDYVAAGGEAWITIGNFRDNAMLNIVNLGTSTSTCALASNGAYYLIDSVNIFPVLNVINYVNTCFGDSTLFSVIQSPNLIATSWDFGDPASGANNYSSNYNAAHLYTAPGNYTITTINYFISGQNDTIVTNITIGALPNVSLGNDTTICIGDSIMLDAGSGYTSYQWSNGNTNSSINISLPGNYFVTVTDNGCIATDSIEITTTNCTINVNFSSSDSSFCEKQCIDFFDLSTNNPTSWQWFFTGGTPDTSTLQNPTDICYNSYGNFDVMLIACNALTCDTLIISNFINEYQNPVDSIWQIGFTLYSLPASNYQWYELTSGLIAGATDSFYTATQPGNYFCVVTDSIGCIATSNTITVTNTAIVENINSGFAFFPNPADDNLTINCTECNASTFLLEVFDGTGRLVYSKTFKGIENNIELDLANGIYNTVFKSGNKISNQKLVIQNQK